MNTFPSRHAATGPSTFELVSLDELAPQPRPRLRANLSSTKPVYGEQAAAHWLPRLPAGCICYNTNITEASNEFLKSTIKRETTPAAATAMPLASPLLLLTQAIFQVVVLLPSNFPLKVTFHLNQALGVRTQTKTKEGKGWGNSRSY